MGDKRSYTPREVRDIVTGSYNLGVAVAHRNQDEESFQEYQKRKDSFEKDIPEVLRSRIQLTLDSFDEEFKQG
tara:strand:- start:366 stop:584 length:219 start_codon:yes stop_codon:yes gene_type:complete